MTENGGIEPGNTNYCRWDGVVINTPNPHLSNRTERIAAGPGADRYATHPAERQNSANSPSI